MKSKKHKKKSKKSKPYLIGVTGSLGTGKSLVGKILSKEGICVVDTDNLVGEILKNRNLITKKLIKTFGKGILSKGRREFLDKKIISNIVFENELKRKKLEAIVHPEVQKRLKNFLATNKKEYIIAVLIPLLFEAGLQRYYDETWCVICDEKTQLKRLQEKGYLYSEAKNRIKAQLPQKVKAKRADYVINNSGTITSTKNQVMKRLKQLMRIVSL